MAEGQSLRDSLERYSNVATEDLILVRRFSAKYFSFLEIVRQKIEGLSSEGGMSISKTILDLRHCFSF